MKLLYLANIRMPTEKAHGLQIIQMCEAFAQAGAEVTLIAAQRVNTPEMNAIPDPFIYYGVSQNFTLRRSPSLDLLPLGHAFERITFPLQSLTYTLFLAISLLFHRADLYYSRDLLTILVLSLFKPRKSLCYEAHQMSKSGLGKRLQSLCVRRVGTVVTVTAKIAEELTALGAAHTHVAHDGFRPERFANLPSQEAARSSLNLPNNAFIIGYTGRLHTISLSKGIDTLIDAIGALPDRPIYLCLVGGPAEIADALRNRWKALGLPVERFIFPGHVPPANVPAYLAAFDVCAMPSPDLEFFRYYASPLKLFEYMAAGRAILSTDLPAVCEVLVNHKTGVLATPGDIPAMSEAIRRLADDDSLRLRLGVAAQQESVQYSWKARAERILAAAHKVEEVRKKLRVVLLSATPAATHGWGRYTRDLIEALANLGTHVELITSVDADPDPGLPLKAYHRLLPPLVPSRRFTILRMLACIPAVQRIITGADIVHIVAEPYMLAVPPTRRTVVTAHGTYLPRTALRKGIGALYRYLYRQATIICVSRFTQSAVLAAVPGLHTSVIANGVNVDRFTNPGTPPTKRGPTILAVGQVKARKGFHILACAMKQVRQVVPDAQAVFIGDTSDKHYIESIKAQLAADNLIDCVHILGRVPEDVLLGWYHAADVFALPAINSGDQFEGFGLVYLEANAVGMPAIGTFGCGAEDAIRDGETGFLVPQHDVTAIADKIIQLLTDPVLYDHMSSAAKSHAEAHGWGNIARRVLDVYQQRQTQ